MNWDCYSLSEKWQKAKDTLGAPRSTLYIVVVKPLFGKPRILGTKYKVKKGSLITDYSVKRYGIPMQFSRFPFASFDGYQHSSALGLFYYPSDVTQSRRYEGVVRTTILKTKLRFYPKNPIDIFYFFRHLEIACVELSKESYIIAGYYDERANIPFILTKSLKITGIYPASDYDDK